MPLERWQYLLTQSCDISTHFVTAPILQKYELDYLTRSLLFEPQIGSGIQTTAILSIAGVPFILCLTAHLFEKIEPTDIGIVMVPMDNVDPQLYFYDARKGISIVRKINSTMRINMNPVGSFTKPQINMESIDIYLGNHLLVSGKLPYVYRRAYPRGSGGESIEEVMFPIGNERKTIFEI
jgi:hypothetical protein